MAEKERITITINSEILNWLDTKVSERTFANRSHGLEFLVKAERENERKDNSNPG